MFDDEVRIRNDERLLGRLGCTRSSSERVRRHYSAVHIHTTYCLHTYRIVCTATYSRKRASHSDRRSLEQSSPAASLERATSFLDARLPTSSALLPVWRAAGRQSPRNEPRTARGCGYGCVWPGMPSWVQTGKEQPISLRRKKFWLQRETPLLSAPFVHAGFR